ncbi:AAA family ATPase [Caenimonas aquaedulcis]|uniref:ATP-binding protein n=1 Tax=Caenimonas aquaedulcis TaxID=2793270 RepID=A0A931MIK5_9BURK|nr:ATP-binding protein [Caenimonas aquaedulcis]MBG9390092.1 ATP-binding protein [Caenimonas aquaedulcis]
MSTPQRTAHLHFFCGKAGAGKSTVARRIASEARAVLLCEDIWLARLFGDRMQTFEDYIACSQRARSVVGPLVTELLSLGQDVVLDFPGNTRASRAWFRSLYESAGAAHTLHYLNTPDTTCLTQIAQRNQEMPEGAHPLSEQDFLHISSFFQEPTAEEGFAVQVHGKAAG